MRCEKFVNEYMPTVKANIAYILYNEYSLKQIEISEILDITQPAVSQYIRGSRGKTTDLSKEIERSIEEVAEEIYGLSESDKITQQDVDDLMCEICKKI
ncbi:MAG: transcriptional regulator [Candidatus Thermoplasmatota archaeon]